MKSLLTKSSLILLFVIATIQSGFSQNQVYWREGFEPNAVPACDLSTIAPTTNVSYYFNGNAGTWYGHNVYRTTATGCPTGNAHLRFQNIAGVTDSGYVVTPIVDYGIKELHFSRARASRSYTIWITNDTLATTTNWTPIVLVKSSATTVTCVDTTVIIYSATAKRLKIVGRPGATTDIDSIWITSYSKILGNYVKGSVFLDANANGIKDANESFMRTMVTTYKQNKSANSLSINGTFSNRVDTGIYTTLLPNRPYYTINPLYKTSVFSLPNTEDSVDFALQPIPNKNDLRVELFSPSLARLGRPVDYYLGYANIGTTAQNAQIKFIKDSRVTIVSSVPNYTSIVNDTLFWDYPNLLPDSFGVIKIKCKIATPPTANLFDTLLLNAYIEPSSGDETPIDNHQLLKQRIRGAYDPNDKQEVHDGNYTLTQLANKELLLYTIRFQNTGNDTAFNIEVKDTLDAKLEISSLEMVSSSHNYKLNIVDNKYCTWTFSNVNLVDSNHNETESHAYITYRISPKASIVANDVIKNSASIYFDYSPAVQTNTHNTVISNSTLPVILQSFTGKLNSNKTVMLNWQASEINMNKYVVEKSVDANKYNALGSVQAINKNNSSYQFIDETPNKGANYYRLQMVENNGKISYSNIVVVLLENNSSITVFPNPAKDFVNVSCKGVKEVKVINQLGQVIYKQIATGTNLRNDVLTINTKEWAKGIYIFSFDNGERVKVVKE